MEEPLPEVRGCGVWDRGSDFAALLLLPLPPMAGDGDVPRAGVDDDVDSPTVEYGSDVDGMPGPDDDVTRPGLGDAARRSDGRLLPLPIGPGDGDGGRRDDEPMEPASNDTLMAPEEVEVAAVPVMAAEMDEPTKRRGGVAPRRWCCPPGFRRVPEEEVPLGAPLALPPDAAPPSHAPLSKLARRELSEKELDRPRRSATGQRTHRHAVTTHTQQKERR